MFQYIYQWMINATFYLVIFTAVMQLIPNESYQKYVRFFTGLIMILLILTPAMKLLGMEKTFLDLYEQYQMQDMILGEEIVEDAKGQIYVEPIQIETQIAK